MQRKITKRYSNGEVTVIWQNDLCIHSANCFRGLPAVFNPRARPWVDMNGADTPTIIAQISKCPSGALTYELAETTVPADAVIQPAIVVEPAANGPLLVHGDITVRDSAGNEIQKNRVTAFCRCGSSGNKPYCDGSHRKIGFEAS